MNGIELILLQTACICSYESRFKSRTCKANCQDIVLVLQNDDKWIHKTASISRYLSIYHHLESILCRQCLYIKTTWNEMPCAMLNVLRIGVNSWF